MKSHELLDNYL